MDSCLKISPSISSRLLSSATAVHSSNHLFTKSICFGEKTKTLWMKIEASSDNGAPAAQPSSSQISSLSGVADMNRKLSSLEALFCYDKPVPEEIIEKPVGLCLDEKNIGEKRRCPSCEAKGAILCATCSGSGLYVDSIMESQGIIVKVRCLGCGGTGNIMCSECGGRGHSRVA